MSDNTTVIVLFTIIFGAGIVFAIIDDIYDKNCPHIESAAK